MVGSRFKTITLSLLALALTTGAVIGIGLVSSRWTRSVLPSPRPGAQPKASGPETIALSPPRKVKPGDWLVVEVLEGLPGRPISGVRIVRPDGTISLGFYGDVQVAGLDRNQIKTKVVNHLRKFLTDEVLGLIEIDPETGTFLETDSQGKEVVKRIRPADTDRVFVDDSADQYSWSNSSDDRLGKIEEKLDRLTAQLDALLKAKTEKDKSGTEAKPSSQPAPAQADASDLRKSDLWKAYEKLRWRGGYPAWSPFEGAETSPFEPAELNSDAVISLGALLASTELTRAEMEKMAAQGKASPDDLARARSSFEAAKLMIPVAVRKAREHLETVKARAIKPEVKEEDHKAQARLRAIQSHLDEAKKLRQEGKISEEEYLNAEGDYGILSGVAHAAVSDRQAEIRSAQSELEAAEQLKAKYLYTTEKPTSKEAKPK